MAGLFDFGSGGMSPQDSGLLALAAGMISGKLDQGLLGYQQAMSPENQLRTKLLQAQIGNYESEIEARKLAAVKDARQQQIIQSILGKAQNTPAGSSVYGPGQLGSGSFGSVPTLPGQTAFPQPQPQSSKIGSMSVDDILALKMAGVDAMPIWKTAKEGFERKPGTFTEDVNGRRSYNADPTKGYSFENGRVGVLPGFADATTQMTLAGEIPKTFLSAASTMTLRKNADGTESPVSALTENPTLQGILSALSGGKLSIPPTPQQAQQPVPQRPATPQPPAQSFGPRIDPTAQKGADAESIRMIQSELGRTTDPATRQALTREIERLTASQSQPGYPTPTIAPTGRPVYGMTNAQDAEAAAARERAIAQAKADVKPLEQRQSAIATAGYISTVIDKALNHPGLSTATGLQGKIDPRNYIPGTDATNFKVVMDQIGGSAFLQAFESLKGGGQITEVEGNKATAALARLNTAQSTEEFKAALGEFKGIIQGAMARMKTAMPGSANAGGAGGDWGANSQNPPPAKVVNDLPKTAPKGARARDRTTGEILRFNGMSWVKE